LQIIWRINRGSVQFDAWASIYLSIDKIAAEIEGCLREGFAVDWSELGNRVFIAVQEPDCPFPSWEKVFAEEAIDDVDTILRDGGFDPIQS